MENRGNIRQFHKILFQLAFVCAVFLYPSASNGFELNSDTIIRLTNEKRAEAGLRSLDTNPLLTNISKTKAEAIFQYQEFAHSIDGKPFYRYFDDMHYNYFYAGENLAIDFFNENDILEAWMKSELHRTNIMDARFQEIGVAVASGELNGEETVIVVQSFGTPKDILMGGAVQGSSFSQFQKIALLFTQGIYLLILLTALALLIVTAVRFKKLVGHPAPKHSH